MGAKGEPGRQHGQPKLSLEPIEPRAYVVLFAFAPVVHALAAARPPKIEAKHWEAEPGQGLHCRVHNLVMQGAAEQRVRVAEQNRRPVRCAGFHAGIQDRLELPGWPAQVFYGAYGGNGRCGHSFYCRTPLA